MQDQQNRLFYICLFLYLTTIAVIMPRAFCIGDMEYWIRWCTHIFNEGLPGAYRSESNYNPLFLYVLAIFGKIQGSAQAIRENIYTLKFIVLLFDIAGALAAMLIVKREAPKFLPFILLLNIAYLYNTVIWGQVDSIHTAFVLFALIAAIRRRPFWALFFFTLALNTKLQAIIFLPLIGLILFPDNLKHQWKGLITGIAGAIILQVLLILPFWLNGDLHYIINLNFAASVDRYPVLSMNAFNFWNLFFSGNLSEIPDTGTFLHITYKNWGFILFFGLSGLALLPFIISIWKKKTPMPLPVIFITATLLTLIFFYFNTQMHERYSHPALLFAGIYGFISGNYLLYGIVSVAYLLNMEKVLQYLQLNNYNVLIFDPRFISLLFLAAIILGFYHLYKTYKEH